MVTDNGFKDGGSGNDYMCVGADWKTCCQLLEKKNRFADHIEGFNEKVGELYKL